MSIGEFPTVTLTVLAGPHAGTKFEFSQHDTFVVGRSRNAHLRLKDDPHFSRHHFRLEIQPPDCALVDLNSRTGTFVNGDRVDECFLQDGDIISGGKTEIRFSVNLPEEYSRSMAPTVIGAIENEPEVEFAEYSPAEQSPPSDPILNLPGYEFHEELGHGGMGVVYRATQRSSQREVALKLLLPSRTSGENVMQLFIREANILSQLIHPRIVCFYEFGLVGDQLFLAMEYIPTIDLKSVLSEQSAESKIRVPCAIICQTLEALTYAHTHSFVHRDIKPPNILVTKNERKLHIKLADFGLAKNYANAGFSGLTGSREFRGTLPFMPPEQVINCREATPACDIYSVGVTLYQFLSEKFPFNPAGKHVKLNDVLEAERIPLNARNEQIPAELSEIVQRALEMDPNDRYRTAEEMRLALLPYSKRNR